MQDRKFVTSMKRPKLIVLVGPTAVGKTAVALRLARHLHTVIVSSDSRQVFRELSLGTAKPTSAELAQVPHYFINSRSIAEDYDAATYATEVHQLLVELFNKHQVVILCGGSGLYIKAVLEGFDDVPEVPASVREGIVANYNNLGLAWLQEMVHRNDPDYYEVVDRKNPQRLMRALEVIQHTGKAFSAYHQKKQRNLTFDVVKIGLTLDRDALYQRISQRMDQMIEAGLFAEAESLFDRRNCPALQTVGYQEIMGYLEGHYPREEAVRLLKRNSRRYAKRQLTWFRKDKSIRWFAPGDWEGILSACELTESSPA